MPVSITVEAPASSASDWVTLGPPIGSLVLAAIVAYVAWRQWRTAHNKLALDLFDKRYAVYQRLNEALSRRHHECHYHPEPFGPDIFRWRDFYLASHDAGLLFGPDVMEIIDKMDEHLGDLEAHHNRLLKGEMKPDKLLDDPDFRRANGAYNSAFVAFERHARAYMMLGHIAKNRPEKKQDWE